MEEMIKISKSNAKIKSLSYTINKTKNQEKPINWTSITIHKTHIQVRKLTMPHKENKSEAKLSNRTKDEQKKLTKIVTEMA